MTSSKSSVRNGADTHAAYTVLARRYRSRDFDELIGQEPIARTLQNAITSGRTAHAYLFCGTRGVGKTSMARIFARALNADDSLAQKDEIAQAIFRGDDLDVIEIDGASNRGIAAAKDLIASAGLSPARCRYKIYIIDEVHALTNDAFNALLKTMEEPPAHVKFILCTTEAHKVPATIQSRCQRFDFRPISTTRIAEQLRKILNDEGVQADDDVVTRVAQLGNGSMRDALSLLDRLLAAGEQTLTVQLLEQMVGLPDQSYIINLMDAIIAGRPAEALQHGDTLLRQGTTVEQALELLLAHLRSLMLVAACGEETELLEVAGETRKTIIAQAAHFDSAGLVHLIALCDAVSRSARHSTAGRALFDAAIVRMCMSEHFASLADILRGSRLPSAPRAEAGQPKKKAPLAHEPVTPSTSSAASPAEQRVTEVKPGPRVDPPTSRDIWQQVLEYPGHTAMAKAKLDGFDFESFDGTTLTLRVNPENTASARMASKEDLAQLVQRATDLRVNVVIGDESTAASPVQEPAGEAAQAAEQLSAVRQAMDIFNARIIHVADQ